MEIDTGASYSLVSSDTFRSLWADPAARPPLTRSPRRLFTYMREEVPIDGVADVTVSYRNQTARLQLLVVDQSGPALLGRDWLRVIRLDWQSLFRVASDESLPSDARSLFASLKRLESELPDVFSSGLGCYRPRKVSLQVDQSAPAKFYKHRPPPLALKKDIEDELDRQVQLGILRPVPTSEWAAPVVPVKKANGSIRLRKWCLSHRSSLLRAVIRLSQLLMFTPGMDGLRSVPTKSCPFILCTAMNSVLRMVV